MFESRERNFPGDAGHLVEKAVAGLNEVEQHAGWRRPLHGLALAQKKLAHENQHYRSSISHASGNRRIASSRRRWRYFANSGGAETPLKDFRLVCASRGKQQQTTKGNNMVVKLEVFKTVHNTWPAKNGMAAGESYDLLCIDVSNLPEHRMEEMLFYRTKPEERETHYVNGTGKTITVGVAKIRHADKSGKATIIGSIIPEAIKK
jgi:hypothetical protein